MLPPKNRRHERGAKCIAAKHGNDMARISSAFGFLESAPLLLDGGDEFGGVVDSVDVVEMDEGRVLDRHGG